MEPHDPPALVHPKFEPVGVSPLMLCPWPIHFPPPISIPQPLPAKKYKRTWSREQVEELYQVTKQHSSNVGKDITDLDYSDFQEIARSVCRTPRKCMSKVMEIQASGTLRSGVWAAEEDALLRQCLTADKKKWGVIATEINTAYHKGLRIRTGKQCKERWNNHLNPCINRGEWTSQDDLNLLESHKRLGNRWSMIAKELGSRTDSSIKNRIKSLINKERQNVDLRSPHGDVLDILIARKRRELEGKPENAPGFSAYAELATGKDNE